MLHPHAYLNVRRNAHSISLSSLPMNVMERFPIDLIGNQIAESLRLAVLGSSKLVECISASSLQAIRRPAAVMSDVSLPRSPDPAGRDDRGARTAVDQSYGQGSGGLRGAVVVLMPAQGRGAPDTAHLLDGLLAGYVRGVVTRALTTSGSGRWTRNGAAEQRTPGQSGLLTWRCCGTGGLRSLPRGGGSQPTMRVIARASAGRAGRW